jgi:sugar phosphate isomerase/epimerase
MKALAAIRYTGFANLETSSPSGSIENDMRRNLAAVRRFMQEAGGKAVAAIDSRVAGVQIGAQSYSFRDRPLDAMISAMATIGLGECELWQGHVEPRTSSGDRRAELRKWRTASSLDYFKQIREKFDRAGIKLSAYNYSFRDDFTDQEIERGFEMAKALGVKALTASSTVSVTRRVAPVAAKYKMMVGMHGHDNLADPNEFAKPESFETAMRESKWIGLNLDIGHFIAAGYDPIPFLKKYHKRTVTVHIKDRKKQQGPNVPWGEGDTPVKPTLEALRDGHWNIPANIEYAYKGADPLVEVKKCYEYCRAALA